MHALNQNNYSLTLLFNIKSNYRYTYHLLKINNHQKCIMKSRVHLCLPTFYMWSIKSFKFS